MKVGRTCGKKSFQKISESSEAIKETTIDEGISSDCFENCSTDGEDNSNSNDILKKVKSIKGKVANERTGNGFNDYVQIVYG